MLTIQTPPCCATERAYILRVLFDDWLGIPWSLTPVEREDVGIILAGQPGEIRLPDSFFGQFSLSSAAWLNEASLPQLPLAHWDTRELSADITLTDPVVPLIQGDPNPALRLTDEHLGLPIDIFGSAFFMLSRYEEAVSTVRDIHDRFPSTASIAYQAGFLDRPIIDEYVEILWAAMQWVWPSLRRKKHQARTLVSCDVDNPFTFNNRFKPLPRRMAGDLLKRHSPVQAMRTLLGTLEACRGGYRRDNYRTAIEWIMGVNERVGNRVAFYFIPEDTDLCYDNRYSLDDQRIRQLLNDIHRRGHEIGIHPGYNTYKYPEAMSRSVQTLRRVLDQESIQQSELGGRQHYLRWKMPITARLWNDNGLDYDTTLTFADRPGFRCGTCREYPLYDLACRQSLRTRERPLILMECSVLSHVYMGLGPTEAALTLMCKWRDLCFQFEGDFTLLWHNSFHLWERSYQVLYETLLGSSR